MVYRVPLHLVQCILSINFPTRLINSINCGNDVEKTQRERESRKNDNTICMMHNGTCDHFQLCVYFTAPSNHLMHILQPTRCTQKFRTNMQMCNQSAYLKSHPTLISIYFICAKRTIFRWKLFLFPTMLTSNVFVIQAVNIKYILIDDTVRLK